MLNYYLLCKLKVLYFSHVPTVTDAGALMFLFYFDKVPTLAMLELMCFVCVCVCVCDTATSTVSLYQQNKL